jgi:hypothetical protein
MALKTKNRYAGEASSKLAVSELLVESFESFSCKKWEAGSRGRGQFGNPEERERLALEAATKQRLEKTEKTLYVL